jgi:hypothetical protein
LQNQHHVDGTSVCHQFELKPSLLEAWLQQLLSACTVLLNMENKSWGNSSLGSPFSEGHPVVLSSQGKSFSNEFTLS